MDDNNFTFDKIKQEIFDQIVTGCGCYSGIEPAVKELIDAKLEEIWDMAFKAGNLYGLQGFDANDD